jgi:hypothetical protein
MQLRRLMDQAGRAVAGAGPHRRGSNARLAGRSGLRFGALGFLLGIAFWHSVGFWHLLERTLDRPAERPGESGPRKAGRVAGDVTTSTAIDPDACVALVLNRLTGETAAEPCGAAMMMLRAGRPGSRSDVPLMPVRRTSARDSWSTTLEAEGEVGAAQP